MAAHLRAAAGGGHTAVLLDVQTTRGLSACVTDALAQTAAAFPTGPVHVVGFSFGALGRPRGGPRARRAVRGAGADRSAESRRGVGAAHGSGAVLLGGVRDVIPGSAALTALPVPSCPIAIVVGTEKLSPRSPITWPIALANAMAGVDEARRRNRDARRDPLPHTNLCLPRPPESPLHRRPPQLGLRKRARNRHRQPTTLPLVE